MNFESAANLDKRSCESLFLASAVVIWRVLDTLCFLYGCSYVRLRQGAIPVVISRAIKKNFGTAQQNKSLRVIKKILRTPQQNKNLRVTKKNFVTSQQNMISRSIKKNLETPQQSKISRKIKKNIGHVQQNERLPCARETNSNDFGVFLELISRFEFEFCRPGNFFF